MRPCSSVRLSSALDAAESTLLNLFWLCKCPLRFDGSQGFLLSQLPKDARRQVNIDHVCSALTVLIRDEDATVRAKCAEAMGMLYDY